MSAKVAEQHAPYAIEWREGFKIGIAQVDQAHLRLHEEFGAHVADFLGNAADWNEERVQELRRFLNKWLMGHIMTHDLRFGKWHASHPKAAPTVAPRPMEHTGLFAHLFGRH